VCSTPAEIAGKFLLHLFDSGMRIPAEQRARRHNHAAGAVAALCRLLIDKSLLKEIGFIRGSIAFRSRNGAPADLLYGSYAGSYRLTVDVHRTGATLRQAAAEFRAVQPKRIPQNIEQWLIRIPGFNRSGFSIYTETIGWHFSLDYPFRAARSGTQRQFLAAQTQR
jgi:hypothetical protein